MRASVALGLAGVASAADLFRLAGIARAASGLAGAARAASGLAGAACAAGGLARTARGASGFAGTASAAGRLAGIAHAFRFAGIACAGSGLAGGVGGAGEAGCADGADSHAHADDRRGKQAGLIGFHGSSPDFGFPDNAPDDPEIVCRHANRYGDRKNGRIGSQLREQALCAGLNRARLTIEKGAERCALR